METYNVVFRNPDEAGGQTGPTVIKRYEYVICISPQTTGCTDSYSGQDDMGVEGWWERLGAKIHEPQQYHL